MAKPKAVPIRSRCAVARHRRRRHAGLLLGMHLARSVRGIPCAPQASR